MSDSDDKNKSKDKTDEEEKPRLDDMKAYTSQLAENRDAKKKHKEDTADKDA